MKKLLLLFLTIIPFTGTGQKLKSFFNGSVELFYEESGNGPALYILSGGPGEAPNRPYRQIIDSLKSYYTCVLLHQRGSGKSRNISIDEKTISIKNYLTDIELLRKKRGDKSVSLLGMSWGGGVAGYGLCGGLSCICFTTLSDLFGSAFV